ncbi:pimeloyl-ACP methyl ester carboxylesterase/AraC-like DNA-binding protein [Saonia flava]|uniref:Pimeloyl-ACP methyl ester carboxylesterase/AraC-like DNA-binding protein n=1 Tax=Saonia flava TaxID=523696 RepID=A0A846QXE7_9FLAO|nr:alpha/beta fold hydrolase [Saonia flava]NJB72628.1 pimeloyl-ACP methyl ester carboxylesterase/AraC-like DNA-binding protein [Saonia flava]
MKPTTQYTKSGSINIAYQVFGSGKIDLVYIPGWVSNIDLMWACPELVNFLLELGKIARVILFDKRGTGLSDRIVELSTLEERMDDIRAVMDAVQSEKAVLFGHSEGGSVSALFAATYPNRTISLITFGIFAKRRYAENYPWAPKDGERQAVYDMIENSWGSGEIGLESLAPSKTNDKEFMDWLANYFRSGASPSAALVLTKMNTEVDIINILGSIKVPTLIMQRTNDIDVKIEEGRFIADRIEGAKFVELDGSDHLFWVGKTKEVLDQMKLFVLKKNPDKNYEQQLFTIGAARIISSQRPNDDQQEFFAQYVGQYRGKVIQGDGQTFIANFEGPSKAVNCAFGLIDTAKSLNAQIVIGIHIKEGAVDESHFISKETGLLIESIFGQAGSNQILVTQTVKYLLSGAGLNFTQNKSVIEPSTGESLLLYGVTDDSRSDNQPSNIVFPHKLPKYDSILENVLQCIDAHLDDELFGVEVLCKEIGISERQLQRKLKATTNKSPIQLISSVRLHRAKELLLQQQNNIAEIAYQTGFSNPSYFSKSFKKEFGLSPSSLLQKKE